MTATMVEVSVRFGVLAVLLYWSFVLIRPFVPIAIWSVVLTVALYPAFDWVSHKLGGRRRLAAAMITIVNVLIVAGPAVWLALALVDTLGTVSEHLAVANLRLPQLPAVVRDLPLIGEQIHQMWEAASTNLAALVTKITPALKPFALHLLRATADVGADVLKFFVSIVVAGFLFSPGPKLANAAVTFAQRLNPTRGESLIDLAGATIRTVARGIIGISVFQTMLAGLGLLVAGVPGASLLTSAVLILGVAQVGPSLVLLPVIIWSWTAMEPWQALAFSAYMLIVNLLDNFLKPLVMGRGLTTPLLVILIGTLGGLISYGLMGLFMGPIVLAVIWELLAAWIGPSDGRLAKRYSGEH
jgi:predicted PurR-regulated permease PerM